MGGWARTVRTTAAVAGALISWGSSQASSSRGSYAASGSGLDLMDVDLMFVGAHPDDDTGMLATLARYLRDEGFKGTVITLTGGEGGGNAIGREAGRALGLIREEEERRALLLAGVGHPHFLGLEDFYFTLSAEEASARWGAGFVCDVVRHVRLERPEVMVTMWPGPGTHGQHQMASRAATLAFDKAGDPGFCPDQVRLEFLRPFSPLKLYYYAEGGKALAGVVSVPADAFSRSAAMRYADLKALAVSQYRSQGYDRPPPALRVEAESFLLARSRVPVLEPETHLLEGALLPAGASPPGVRLEVEPETAEAMPGRELSVRVSFGNTAEAVSRLRLELGGPEGWGVVPAGRCEAAELQGGESFEASFRVLPPASAKPGELVRLQASYAALRAAGAIGGRKHARLRVVSSLRAAWKPLFDVAGYREFARETRTDWIIPSLPARIPAVIGRRTPVAVELLNHGPSPVRGELVVEPRPGVKAAAPVAFALPPGARGEATVRLEVDPAVLPEGRRSVRVPVSLVASPTGVRDEADLYALPALLVPRLAKPPLIDGDLADMEGLARGSISPKDLWARSEPKDAADLSADFFLGHDGRHLYVGVRVRDEAVVCNIAPNDVKAQLRSDAVGVTVDPSGRSRDTSTTFQAAAFPCTTSGFGARGFRDADARPGLMEETAPGMQVVSRKTADGYEMEFALPFSAMPALPRPGDEIGLNVVLYDGDQKDARPGANINESGLAWASFALGGKQALPYLWPRLTLGR